MSVTEGKLKAFTFFDGQSNASNEHEANNSTHYGEFDLSLNSLKLCVLSGHKGDPNEQYICLYTDQLELSHDNHVLKQTGDFFKPTSEDQLDQLFAKTKHNVVLQHNDLAKCIFDERQLQLPMVSIAMHSLLKEPSKLAGMHQLKTKEILIAININNICLNHMFCNEKFHWLMQLIDLVNLKDIDITGYIQPVVITELHLNVTNSSVDYRPVNLKTKSLIAFKSLRISSNVTQNSQLTMLVFNIEDLFVFLTNRQFTKTDVDMAYDLRRDYVCIANTDVFEFRLLISDKASGQCQPVSNNNKKKPMSNAKMPIIDIKIRCNLIQVRTCVDSCFTLIELLSYICMDGDLCAAVGDSKCPDLETQLLNWSACHAQDTTMTGCSPRKDIPLRAQSTIPVVDNDAHIKNMVDDAMLSDNEQASESYQYESPFAQKLDMAGNDNDSDDDQDCAANTDHDESFGDYVKDDDLLCDFDIVDLIPGILGLV